MATSRVFVGRIAPETTQEGLTTHFEKYGPVSKCDVKNGYAFVFFSDERDSVAALQASGSELDGSRIVVEEARSKGADRGGYRDRDDRDRGDRDRGDRDRGERRPLNIRQELRYRIHGVSSSVDWRDIKDWARAAGDVTFANVSQTPEGPLGVVEFANEDSFAKAPSILEDIPLRGDKVRLVKEVNEDGTLAPAVTIYPRSGPPNGGYGNRDRGGYRDDDPRGSYNNRGGFRDNYRGGDRGGYDDRGRDRAPPRSFRDAPPYREERGRPYDSRGPDNYSQNMRTRSRSRDADVRSARDVRGPAGPGPVRDVRDRGGYSGPADGRYDDRDRDRAPPRLQGGNDSSFGRDRDRDRDDGPYGGRGGGFDRR